MQVRTFSEDEWRTRAGRAGQSSGLDSELALLGGPKELVFVERSPRFLGPRRLLVQVAEGVIALAESGSSDDAVLAALGLEGVRRLAWEERLWWVRLGVPASQDAIELRIDWLKRQPGVVWAEAVDYQLDDSLRGGAGAGGQAAPGLWYLEASGFTAAWQAGFDGAGQSASLVDSGFVVGHPQLQGAIAIDRCGALGPSGSAFAAGTDGLDTSGTGGDTDHGTSCAGLVAAQYVSDLNPVGGAPQADVGLVALRNTVLHSQLQLARALAYAMDPTNEGVNERSRPKVVSCSIASRGGARRRSRVLESVYEYCLNLQEAGQGPLVVQAAPDSLTQGAGVDEVVTHPALLLVGAYRPPRPDFPKSTKFSGTRGVELLAPGFSCLGLTSVPGKPVEQNGTSLAAPIVAAAALLLHQEFPTLSTRQIRDVLKAGARRMPDQYWAPHRDFGHGRLSIEGARERARELLRRSRAGPPMRAT